MNFTNQKESACNVGKKTRSLDIQNVQNASKKLTCHRKSAGTIKKRQKNIMKKGVRDIDELSRQERKRGVRKVRKSGQARGVL